MVNLWQELERLDQIRTEILANLSILNTEISSFESLCEGQDDELLEHISPIQKALAEMITLTTKVLPQKDQEIDAVLQEKLEDIVSFQRKFVHDLRNPLGVVLGYSELLEEILDDYDDFDGSLLILKNKLRYVGENLQKFNQHLNLLFPNPNHHMPLIYNLKHRFLQLFLLLPMHIMINTMDKP
jgi:signal transduction histidine kinase